MNQFSTYDYGQGSLGTLDPNALKFNPQPNMEITRKSTNVGFNYFSSFKGQKVVVTGASKGVGRAVSKTLLDSGAYVAMVSKNKTVEDFVKLFPGQAFAFRYDITEPGELNVCFKKVIETFKGDIDILINCRGEYYCKEFEETTLQDWDQCINENCRSVVHWTNLCIPFIEKSLGNKAIVFLTAEANEKPLQGELIFSVTKSMINMYVECLALELAESKVRVNGVASDFSYSTFKIGKDKGLTEIENKIFLDSVMEIKPLKTQTKEKISTPEDIANTMLWLASSDASFVTGEIIHVDDGMSMTSTFPKPKSQMD